MNKRIFWGLIALTAVTACHKENVDFDAANGIRHLVVHAGVPGTRTSLEPRTGGGYDFMWDAGDALMLAQIEGTFEENTSFHLSTNTVGQRSDEATFAFSLPAATTDQTAYFGIVQPAGIQASDYPHGSPFIYSYLGSYDHDFYLILPHRQSPTASSFDPKADLLISEEVVPAEQPGEVSMRFGRIGSILKLTLKGLPAGKRVRAGYIGFKRYDRETVYIPGGRLNYSPRGTGQNTYGLPINGSYWKTDGQGAWIEDEGSVDFYDQGIKVKQKIIFTPQDVVVNNNEEAVIWLRVLAGVADFFSVYACCEDDIPTRYYSYSKTDCYIPFVDGGMTEVGVKMDRIYEFEATCSLLEATTNSLRAFIRFDPLKGVDISDVYQFKLAVYDNYQLYEEVPLENVVIDAEGYPTAIFELTDIDTTQENSFFFQPIIVERGYDSWASNLLMVSTPIQ